jgi:hypothetical protein
VTRISSQAQFLKAVDTEVGEGHDAFVVEAVDPDRAVLGYFEGDVEDEMAGYGRLMV